MICLSVDSCFVWVLTHDLLESRPKQESTLKQNMSQHSNKTWVNSLTKHESTLKQNMGQLSNKTWVNTQTKHGSTHKQNMSQLSSKTWVNSLTKHETTLKQNMRPMFCLWVDSWFVWVLNDVLFECWLMFC
jgi:hypothetical protein